MRERKNKRWGGRRRRRRKSTQMKGSHLNGKTRLILANFGRNEKHKREKKRPITKEKNLTQRKTRIPAPPFNKEYKDCSK